MGDYISARNDDPRCCCSTEEAKPVTMCEVAYHTAQELRIAIADLDDLIRIITGNEPVSDDTCEPKSFVDNVQMNDYLTSLLRVKLTRLKEVF